MQNWINPNLIANSAGSMGPAGPVMAVMLVAGSGFVGMASPLFSFVGASPDKRAADLLETPGAQAWDRGAAQVPTLRFALAPASVAAAPSSPAVTSSRVAAVPAKLHRTAAVSAVTYSLDSSIDFSAPARPIANAAIPVVAFSPRIESAATMPEALVGPAIGQALVQTADPAVPANEPFALLASAVSLPPVQPSASANMQGVQPSVIAEADLSAGYAPAPAIASPAFAEPPTDNPDSKYKHGPRGIEFDVAAKVNGVPAGKVPLLIADGENFSVRLADVLTVVEPMLDKAVYDSLSASQSAGEYVTLNTLRKSGIAVGFDANDQLIFGSK